MIEQTCQKRKRYSYIIASACFVIQAVGIGTFVTYGVFFNSLMAEFGWSRAVVAGASSCAFFVSGVFAILIGRLNDSYGPRNLMRVTSIFFGVGFMLMSQVTEVWQLYVFYGLLFGIGLAAIDVIALTTTIRWFSRSRGMMTGIVKVGTGAGQFSIPLLASILIVSQGWRQSYLIIGAAAFIILFSIAQVLKRDPGDLGTTGSQDRENADEASRMEEGSFGAGEAMRTVQFWTICIVYLLIVFCLLIILVHIVPHGRDVGLSVSHAAGVLSTIGAVSMVGRFVSGIGIDHVGSKRIMVIWFFVLIAGFCWLQIAESRWMLYLFACVYGLAHGGFFTAISPIVAEVFGTRAHGAIFGILVCFGTTGGAIGPIIAGYLFDMSGSYTSTFRMVTILSVAGLGMMLSLRPIKKKIL